MIKPNKKEYENGVRAYLAYDRDNYYLELDRDEAGEIEGVFFRSMHTDFNTGLFKLKQNGERKFVKVVDNRIKMPSDLFSKFIEKKSN